MRNLKIYPQDDDFLDARPWDFRNTPSDHYPLLLFYHPLNIYRRQVIKQADVVLAMFLLGNAFSPEAKQRNFEFYDPLTTGTRHCPRASRRSSPHRSAIWTKPFSMGWRHS